MILYNVTPRLLLPTAIKVTLFPIAGGEPQSLAAGADGSIWFTDDGSSRIGRLSSDGKVAYFWPHSTQFVEAITLGPDHALWFTGQSEIGRITPTGTLTEFPYPHPNGANALAEGITTGPDGNLWITDPLSDLITRMSPSGVVLNQFHCAPHSMPETIVAGPDGNLWFVETLAQKIGRITPSGKITEYSIPVDDQPGGIARGPEIVSNGVWEIADG